MEQDEVDRIFFDLTKGLDVRDVGAEEVTKRVDINVEAILLKLDARKKQLDIDNDSSENVSAFLIKTLSALINQDFGELTHHDLQIGDSIEVRSGVFAMKYSSDATVEVTPLPEGAWISGVMDALITLPIPLEHDVAELSSPDMTSAAIKHRIAGNPLGAMVVLVGAIIHAKDGAIETISNDCLLTVPLYSQVKISRDPR